MLPDYIIYDELERMRREEQANQEERPRLELPLYMPYWQERDERDESETESDRGVIIIQM